MKRMVLLLLFVGAQLFIDLSAQTNVVFILVDDLGWKDLGLLWQ